MATEDKFEDMKTQDMSIEQAIGQLLVVGFDEATTKPPAFITQALAQQEISGVILFRRNVQSVEQVVSLNEAIHAACAEHDRAPFVCVDQEGGRVVRLREPFTKVGPMGQLAQVRDMRQISDLSEVMATELQAVGFNVNFAPVLDVDTNPNNPVIGDRALSDDPARVAQLGGAFVMGHIMGGVMPCGKHFPGHGDTDLDSHHDLPTLLHDRDRLDRVELVPFRRLIRAKIPMIMTAHIIATAIDPVYPATLSEAAIQGLLRDEMGYDGVVVSDCLEMKAVADFAPVEELVTLGLKAGVDLFLICHTEDKWRRARRHLLDLSRTDEVIRARIMESAQRIVSLKAGFLGHMQRPWRPEASWRQSLGHPDHRAIVERLPWQDAHTRSDPTESTP